MHPVAPSQPYGGQDYLHAPLVGTQKPISTGRDDDDETYFNRLQRTQQPVMTNTGQTQNPGAQPQLTASSTSPVTPNGKMNTAPAAPAQPAATTGTTAQTASGQTRNTGAPLQDASAAQPPAISPDPFASMGGGVWTGQQWVPRDHPLAKQAVQPPAQPGQSSAPPPPYPGYAPAPAQPGNSTYYADDLGNEAFAQYLGTLFNVDLPNAYQAGDISQWGGFDEGPEGEQMRALIQRILANPHTMNDTAVAALKSGQKETADALRAAQTQAAGSAAAASGRFGSGTAAQSNAAVDSNFASQILGSYRDIDLAKLAQDRADEIGALEVSDALLNTRFGRASEGYRNTLAGQQTREQAAQAAAASGLDRSRLDFDVQNAQATDNRAVTASTQEAQRMAFQRALEQANINQAAARSGFDNWGMVNDQWNADQDRRVGVYNADADRGLEGRRIDLQDKLGTGGLELDRAKLSESGRQFDKGYQLDFLNYLLNKDQFADNSSLNWATLNSNNINNWLNGL